MPASKPTKNFPHSQTFTRIFSERDRSGTTREAHEVRGAGDGADSPTQVREAHEAARPNLIC
jgi:hypothetical protein